jgi:hypothetical protein
MGQYASHRRDLRGNYKKIWDLWGLGKQQECLGSAYLQHNIVVVKRKSTDQIGGKSLGENGAIKGENHWEKPVAVSSPQSQGREEATPGRWGWRCQSSSSLAAMEGMAKLWLHVRRLHVRRGREWGPRLARLYEKSSSAGSCSGEQHSGCIRRENIVKGKMDMPTSLSI